MKELVQLIREQLAKSDDAGFVLFMLACMIIVPIGAFLVMAGMALLHLAGAS